MVMISFIKWGCRLSVDRKLVGYNVGAFGLGILCSAIIYPLGTYNQ
jgi:hypothetical protein